MLNNFTLDSYELNSLVRSSYGSRSDDHIEDTIINGPLAFARCYEEAMHKDEFGAYLIITGNQYIFAKNCDDGVQGHMLSITKTFLELEGKNSDISILEAARINPKYDKNFLIFSFEIKKDKINRRTEKMIRTTLNHSKISKEEYELFHMFYEEYKDAIKYASFDYNVWNKEVGKYVKIKNLDKLDQFLSTIVDENTHPYELENGEKIVGIPLKRQESNNVLKKML